MTIAVVDAATVVDLICDLPAAEPYGHHLAMATIVAAPAHLDGEVLSMLDRLKRAGHLTKEAARVEALAPSVPDDGRFDRSFQRLGRSRTASPYVTPSTWPWPSRLTRPW